MTTGANSEEFEAFFKAHFDRLVRRWSRELGGVTADAEDLVQDAMIALASKWGEIETPDAWMHRVCARGAAKVVRRRCHPVRGAIALQDPHTESLAAEPENRAAISEAYLLASEFVSGPLEWKALNLHAQGCTAAEIAEILRADSGWRHRRMSCSAANVGKMVRQEKARLSQQVSRRLAAVEHQSSGMSDLIVRTVVWLPEKQRVAFGLRLLGLRHAETAAVMGTAQATARMNLCHANRKLAEAFELPAQTAPQTDRFIRKNLDDMSRAYLLGTVLARADEFRTFLSDTKRAKNPKKDFTGPEDENDDLVLAAAFELGRFAARHNIPSSQTRAALETLTDRAAERNVAKILYFLIKTEEANRRDMDFEELMSEV